MDHVEVLRGLLAAGGADPFSESERRSLQAAIAALSAKPEGEAVAWVEVKDSHEGPYDFNGLALLPKGKHHLYLHPPRSHGVVVDEAMVERAIDAFGDKDGFIPQERDREHWKARMRAAIVASLEGKRP